MLYEVITSAFQKILNGFQNLLRATRLLIQHRRQLFIVFTTIEQHFVYPFRVRVVYEAFECVITSYSIHYTKLYDWNKPYKKSARVVGDVIGKYHPHGDTAVYDTIVRMRNNFV